MQISFISPGEYMFVQLPKVLSVLGGICLVFSVPLFGFILLGLSAFTNFILSIKNREHGNSIFFGAWTGLNTFFAVHGSH
jgi:hypothetical protein